MIVSQLSGGSMAQKDSLANTAIAMIVIIATLVDGRKKFWSFISGIAIGAFLCNALVFGDWHPRQPLIIAALLPIALILTGITAWSYDAVSLYWRTRRH